MVHIEIIKKELNNNYIVIYDNEIKKEILLRIQKFDIFIHYNTFDFIVKINYLDNNYDVISHKQYVIWKVLKYMFDTKNSNKSLIINEINFTNEIEFNTTCNEIIDKIKLLNDKIKELDKNYNKYCVISGELLSLSNEYETTDERLKNMKLFSYSAVKDNKNFISNYFQNYKENSRIILKLLFDCISSDRIETIWNPKPEFLIKDLKLLNNNELKVNIINTIYYLIDNIEYIDNDFKIFKKSPLSYIIIKFSIMNFKKFTFQNWDINVNSNIEVLKVVYEDEQKSKDFNKSHLNRLFHGSSNQNWFSIFFNGLQTGTKENKLFMNGSAYGRGIYLSDTTTYSVNYSNRNNSKSLLTNSTTLSNNSKNVKKNLNSVIIGVFILKNDKKKYFKSRNIFVVNDGNDICLEYLLILSPTEKIPILKQIDNYFINNLGKKLQEQKIDEQKIGNKRIMGEMKMLFRNNDKMDDSGLHYIVKYNEQNIYTIKFILPKDNFDVNTDLYKDLIKFNYDDIEIEMNLPDNYPFAPPFVRISKPRFKFLTGHITRGGSICMELLTNQGWVQSTNMMKILMLVKIAMIEGNARLDSIQHSKKYTMQEAKSAYQRMLSSHNWN